MRERGAAVPDGLGRRVVSSVASAKAAMTSALVDHDVDELMDLLAAYERVMAGWSSASDAEAPARLARLAVTLAEASTESADIERLLAANLRPQGQA